MFSQISHTVDGSDFYHCHNEITKRIEFDACPHHDSFQLNLVRKDGKITYVYFPRVMFIDALKTWAGKNGFTQEIATAKSPADFSSKELIAELAERAASGRLD